MKYICYRDYCNNEVDEEFSLCDYCEQIDRDVTFENYLYWIVYEEEHNNEDNEQI